MKVMPRTLQGNVSRVCLEELEFAGFPFVDKRANRIVQIRATSPGALRGRALFFKYNQYLN